MNISREFILAKLKESGKLLKSNQGRISLPVVNRICKKMTQNLMFPDIHVSSEDLIVDGHHRYIASILSNFELGVVHDYPAPSKTNEIEWKNVEFTEDDWDSASKIRMLNEIDAKYNNMDIADVQSIIA